jgi:hypothetical protein
MVNIRYSHGIRLFSNNKIIIDVIIMVNFNHGREMEQGMDCFVLYGVIYRLEQRVRFALNGISWLIL